MSVNLIKPTAAAVADSLQLTSIVLALYAEALERRQPTNLDRRVKYGSFDWTPPAVLATTAKPFVVGALAGDVTSRSVVGLKVGQAIAVTAPGVLPLGLTVSALVQLADQLTITIANTTGAPLTPPAGTWAFFGIVV